MCPWRRSAQRASPALTLLVSGRHGNAAAAAPRLASVHWSDNISSYPATRPHRCARLSSRLTSSPPGRPLDDQVPGRLSGEAGDVISRANTSADRINGCGAP